MLWKKLFVPKEAALSCLLRQKQAQRFSSSNAVQQRPSRKRFFAQVDIQPTSPPWKTEQHQHQKQPPQKTISSPISAGVDGTNSASGVVLAQKPSDGTDSSHPEQHQLLLQYADSTWYSITLDGHTLKTPLGQILAVPSIHLAYALAAEWNATAPTKLIATQMPFTTLVCTTLDQTCRQPHHYQEQLFRYFKTDTVCYWADPVDDADLYNKQQVAWNDLYNWINQWISASTTTAPIASGGNNNNKMDLKSILTLDAPSHSILRKSLPYSPDVIEFVQEYISSLNAWQLTAAHALAAEAKSFWIAAALLEQQQQHGRLTVDAAQRAARVEEEFQIELWGLVEGQHDYDRLNGSIQMRSAVLLNQFLTHDNR